MDAEPPALPDDAPDPATAARAAQNLGVTSLVLGVAGLLGSLLCFIGGFFSIAATVCGHIGLRRARQTPPGGPAMGLSLAGTILGYVGIAVALFSLAVTLVVMQSLNERVNKVFEEVNQKLEQQQLPRPEPEVPDAVPPSQPVTPTPDHE